jgi:hypothetical protein
VIKIKHDDFCPCARFRLQPEFCTCNAAECESDLNAGIERFGRKLRDINRAVAPEQGEAK